MGNTHPTKKEGCLSFLQRRLFKTKFIKLISSIKNGNLALVKHYHFLKVNFSHYMDNGDTPLHIAVKYNQMEIVRWICENVAHVNINDKNFIGDTPLLLAIMNGNPEIVRYLVVNKKAEVNLAENRGFTPFIAACANGNLEIVKFLVTKAGADISMKSYDGQTGLHRAAFYGNYEILVYLIKHLRMNVLVPDRKGNLPLHSACIKLNVTCARLLLKVDNKGNGTSLYVKNKYGLTPLEILVKQLNRFRETDLEPYEFKIEEIRQYLKDKNNYPHKKHKSLLSPTNTKSRRGSLMDRTNDLKRKLKDMFGQNKGSQSNLLENSINSNVAQESDVSRLLKIASLSEHPGFVIEEENPQPPTNRNYGNNVEDHMDMTSEEQRLTALNSPSRTNVPNLMRSFSGNPNRKLFTPTQVKATNLFMSRLSTIRRGERSPTTSGGLNETKSFSGSETGTPTIKRASSKDFASPHSGKSTNEESKVISTGLFTTKTRSKFAMLLSKKNSIAKDETEN